MLRHADTSSTRAVPSSTWQILTQGRALEPEKPSTSRIRPRRGRQHSENPAARKPSSLGRERGTERAAEMKAKEVSPGWSAGNLKHPFHPPSVPDHIFGGGGRRTRVRRARAGGGSPVRRGNHFWIRGSETPGRQRQQWWRRGGDSTR